MICAGKVVFVQFMMFARGMFGLLAGMMFLEARGVGRRDRGHDQQNNQQTDE
jgi:hypothetical protein